MSVIGKIAAQAYRTFCKPPATSDGAAAFSNNLSKLRELVGRLTAHDVNLDDSLMVSRSHYDSETGVEAPVTYVDIWRDDCFSMSIFIMRPGTCLPMHDHPGMHGLIKVLHGQLGVASYSLVDEVKSNDQLSSTTSSPLRHRNRKRQHPRHQLGRIFSAKRSTVSRSGLIVDSTSETLLLTPTDGNIHEIRAFDKPAAFFDILAPPYDEHFDDSACEHPCNYYRRLQQTQPMSSTLSPGEEIEHLLCIPTPKDYWTDYAPYTGPAFNPYD